MKSLQKNQKNIIIGISIILLIILPLMISTLFFKKFKIIEFKDQVTIKYQEEFKEQPGKVCYGNIFKCEEINYSLEENVDSKKIGEYRVFYRYIYNNKTFEKEQTVKVIDDIPPTIEFKEEQQLYYCENGTTGKYNVKAMDDYDGDITDKIETKVINGKIKFTVRDSSNNETSVEKEAEKKDIEKPILKLIGGEKTYIEQNEPYKEEGATAYDNCDKDLTDKIEIEGKVDSSKIGIYQIKYKVKDSSSNEVSIIREVIVHEKENRLVNNKNIYLTFDDGPGKYTEELLNILKKYNVKATFFVTNQALTTGYDNLLLRAYNEGHTIGLHSYSHNYNIYTNEDTYFEDLYKIQDKVKKITGHTSNIIRFPGGSSNSISKNYDNGAHIMSTLSKKVKEKGFKYYDWNVISGDAGETKDTTEIISNVISNFGKFKTTIVLQHDIKEYSIKAVPAILEYGLTHGYNFLPISEDTEEIHHHLNN